MTWRGTAVLVTGARRFIGSHLVERLAWEGARARFAGAVPPHALQEYLAAANVFALNSTSEGFPHVALEAMAAGLPVIAAAAGGTPEAVMHDQTGLLVSPGDEPGLRSAIAALLADPRRRERLAAAGRAWIERFSWEALLDRLLPILRDLSGERGASADRGRAAAVG